MSQPGENYGKAMERSVLDQIAATPRKEQEFIDHTLLAPTYIRDSNNFIMELIEEHQFPKNVQVPTTVSGVDTFAIKDALEPDIHFQNTIFHFVNKHDGTVAATDAVASTERVSTGPSSPLTMQSVAVVDGGGGVGVDVGVGVGYGHKHAAQFLTLNGDFLASDAGTDARVPVVAAIVPEFPSLALLAETNGALDDRGSVLRDEELLYDRNIARKVLPHKKRISRKLKADQHDAESSLHEPLEQHHAAEERLSAEVVRFSCELCGYTTATQLQFFAHLKQHYEPTTPDTILAAMKTSLDALQPEKDCDAICDIAKKAEAEDQVFHDVHLNFEDFHNVAETVRDVIHENLRHGDVGDGVDDDDDDDMKILTSNSLDKCISFVAHSDAATPLKSIVPDEVEFSDTEDMLEGIRNVVDKVSIEDTCDDIDLMTPMRGPWFSSNDNLSTLAFKSKPFAEMSFAGALVPMPAAIGDDDTMVDDKAPRDDALAAAVTPLKTYINDDDGHVLEEVGDDERDMQDDDHDNDDDDEEEEDDDDDDDADDDNDSDLKRTLPAASSDVSQRKHADKNGAQLELSVASGAGGGAETLMKKHACTNCAREFNSSNALKYHIRTHLGVRPHQCDICGKSFFALGALKSHLRTHSGDKPYGCEVCQRKFRQYGDLKYHITSLHSDEKSHQCEFCGKAFARKYSLVLHRRIHTSEKNYKCDYCPKSFSASVYLQNHRKIHTGEKPYECGVCAKKFRVSGDLRRHMHIHERQQQPPPAKAPPPAPAPASTSLDNGQTITD